MSDLLCKRCKKPIVGAVKIYTYRKTLGSKSVSCVDYYDEECFIIIRKKGTFDESTRQTGIDKKKNCC